MSTLRSEPIAPRLWRHDGRMPPPGRRFTYDDLVLPLYVSLGVTGLWLVDPVACTLEVYRAEQGGWRLLATHAGGDVVSAEPFEAIELALARLWETRT